MPRIMFAVWLSTLVLSAQANERIDFRRSEAWDIRCYRPATNGQIRCDLYLVINYKPHPDFRAAVIIISLDQANRHWVQIDLERQSRPQRVVAAGTELSLLTCDKPCRLDIEASASLLALIEQGARLELLDHGSEAFSLPIDTAGFNAGLSGLAEMQARYR